MTIGTLFILIGIVILFTLSIGIILSHRSGKASNKVKLTDEVSEILDDGSQNEEIEIL